MLARKYPLLNGIGTVLWILGFFMAAARIYPYAFIGVYAGPVLLFLGGIGWFQHKMRVNGRLPNPFILFRGTARNDGFIEQQFAVFRSMASSWVIIWFICVDFWVLVTFAGNWFIKRTEVYRLAVLFVQQDLTLERSIGAIRYEGFLVGGSFRSNGNDHVTFTVVGEHGVREAHVETEASGAAQKVVSASYR